MNQKLSGFKTKSKEEMKAKIVEVWEQIPLSLCKKLVDSMQKRIRACIDSKGGHIKY